MKVYVVMGGDWDTDWILGVYLKREDADRRLAEPQRPMDPCPPGYIEEHDVIETWEPSAMGAQS